MTNAYTQYSKSVDSELVQPLQNVTVGRRLVYVTAPKGFGVTSVDWGKISDMSGGYVSYGFADGNEDMIDVALTNSKVPVYWKDYKVDRRLYNGWMINNTDMDVSAAQSAGYVATATEDAAIINGVTRNGTTYDINGLYQGAGNNYSTSADFGTYGNAMAAIAGAKQLMVDDGIPAYNIPLNLALSSEQYGELEKSTDNGFDEWPKVLRMLNGGSVYPVPSTVLGVGTGMLLPTPSVGRPYVDFFLTSNFRTEHGVDSKHPDTSDLYGRVYSAGILRIKHANAICKLSNI
jgi:uncharacterized linocin/CFP29 family protein